MNHHADPDAELARLHTELQGYYRLRERFWELEKSASNLHACAGFDESILKRKISFRRSVDDHGLLWVLTITVPFAVVVFSFVAGYVVTESWFWSVSGALACFPLVAIGIRKLLFVPSTAELERRLLKVSDEAQQKGRELDAHREVLQRLQDDIHKLLPQVESLETVVQKQQQLRDWEKKAAELLAGDWRVLRGIAFEQYVARIFQHLGYTVEETAVTGDQGVDLIVSSTSRTIAIQVKGYGGSVGNDAVQQVYAGMRHYRCNDCAVVTNSNFTIAAQKLARSVDCRLIDGQMLKSLIQGNIFPRVRI